MQTETPRACIAHLTVYGSCNTRYSVGFRTVYDALRREKRGAVVLENGKPYQTIVYDTREQAVIAARATAQIRTAIYAETGANGWPLIKGTDSEMHLHCPKCSARSVTMGTQWPVYGTGPGGRGRMGDPGAMETIKCNACGHSERTAG